MTNENKEMLWITLSILFVLILGFSGGASFMLNYMKKEAIKNKVATYIPDENGNVKFIWLSNTNLNINH